MRNQSLSYDQSVRVIGDATAAAPQPSLQACLVFSVVLLAAIQCLAIALSLGSIRLTQAMALLVLAIATALAFLLSRSSEPRPLTVAPQVALSLFSPLIRRALLIPALTIYGAFALAAYLTTDFSYDGNSYHIPTINQWARRGFISDVDPTFANSEVMNGYPKGAETVTFVVVQAFGSKFLNLLNLLYAPLGFFGVAVLCQLLGSTIRDSLVFGAAYLIVNANVIQYTSTYVDAAFGSAVIALLALLATNLVTRRGSWLAEALIVGCAIGNVIAVKSSGLLIAIISTVMFVAWGIEGAHRLRTRLPALLLMTSLSLVFAGPVGGFWYLKNYVRHGSPLYPVGLSVAGHTIWPGQTMANALNEGSNTPSIIRALNPIQRIAISWMVPLTTRPWAYPLSGTRFYETDTRLGGLGAFWIVGCVPAIVACIYCLKRRNPQNRLVYYFLGSSVLLAFVGMPLNWWGRYTIWLFALGLPSIWVVLTVARDSGPGVRRFVWFWATVSLSLLVLRASVVMLAAGIRPIAEIKRGEYHLPSLVIRRESPLLPLFPEMRSPLLAEILHTQATVGVGPRELGFEAETIYGQLAVPIGRRNLVPVPTNATEAEVTKLRSDAGLKYILWLTASPVPSLLAPHVRTLGSEGRFTYLELTTERVQ